MAEKKTGVVVRVLTVLPVGGKTYNANDAVEFSAGDVEQLKSTGAIDDGKEAVEYCTKTLGKKVIKHEAVVDAAATGEEA